MPPMGEQKPTDVREAQPFHRCARPSHKMGWPAFPLPYKSKEPPPTGATGGVTVSSAAWGKKLEGWLKRSPKNSGMGYRMPDDVLCIDVDAYKDKGLDTLANIAEELGVELPDTWRHSARFDGTSGHYFFRIPVGLKWPGKIGDGIETVHAGHRYIVAAPSLHKDAGSDPEVGRYLWYAPDEQMDGEGHIEAPPPSELPELPEEWIEYLTSGRHAKHLRMKDFASVTERDAAIVEWISSKGETMCNTMATLIETVEGEMGPGAHDLTNTSLYRLAAFAAEGHRGLAPALEALYELFADEVARDDRAGTARDIGSLQREFLRSRDGAIRKVMSQEEEALFYGYPEECSCAEVGTDGRPKRNVNLNSYDLHAEIPRHYAALAPEADGYGAYMFGDKMVQLLPGRHVEITLDYLRALVAGRVSWTKTIRSEEGAGIPVPAVPPKEFLASLLADERRYDGLPGLRGIVKTPFWARVDGKPMLIGENGYHPEAKVFLDMDPEMTASMAGMDLDPAPNWVSRARRYLDEMLAGFPFDGPADKANALAAFILPFVRELIDGPSPLHLFEAPTAGTGKGLLADCVAMIACGAGQQAEGREMVAVGKDRNATEEMRKAVTTAMLRMPTVLILDNIDAKLDSSSLASALTNYPMYEDRLLGGNTAVRVPNRVTWMATANNIIASRDIVRRIVPTRIDTGDGSPHLRKFDVNLREWVPANRPALVWSILTLVANWLAKGGELSSVRMGSFEAYAGVIGGILDANDYPGFLLNRKRFEDAAMDDGEDVIDLFESWEAAIGLGRRNGKRAIELLQPGILPGVGNYVAVDQPNAHTVLGQLFGKYRSKPVGKYRLMKGKRNGVAEWYLALADGSDSDAPPKKRRVKAVR